MPWILIVMVMLAGRIHALDVETSRLVDLTHAFDDTTVYWPTARSLSPRGRARLVGSLPTP